MSDQSKLGIGKIITTEQGKDAIHVAVAPVTAACRLHPGDHVGLDSSGMASDDSDGNDIGVVDPFLIYPVKKGEKFWLFLYPGSITSLAHVWTHPSFPEAERATGAIPAREKPSEKSASEIWMRRWAIRHMGEDYCGDGGERSEDDAYASAIKAGHDHFIGPYEDARDHIDNTWWNHWELITGEAGDRDSYFSCSC